MKTRLNELVERFHRLRINEQIDYEKFYLYSLITHSTAIEGSTITELENQIMFDYGVSLKGKSIEEQAMNFDLKHAYEKAAKLASEHTPFSIELLQSLATLVMKNTGREYHTALGDFSSAQGDLRLLNVTTGVGGKSYINYNKVPIKLSEFCQNINQLRKNANKNNVDQLYQITFDAHYNLVTIHPWADGNGRMARLVMNMLQWEFGLIPTKISKESKEEYIKALVATREEDNLDIFRDFMTTTMVSNLEHDIKAFIQSLETHDVEITSTTPHNSRNKIIELIKHNRNITTTAMAKHVGIGVKAVEKHLARLKRDGIVQRIGAARGGHWKIIDSK